MKLELKHLAPYLRYDLKFSDLISDMPNKFTLDVDNISGVLEDAESLNTIRLHLRKLTDLTKEIEVNGEIFQNFSKLLESITRNKWVYFKEEEELHELTYEMDHNGNKYSSVIGLPYWIIEKLFEWHFDIYGLIENGLAIDINTL